MGVIQVHRSSNMGVLQHYWPSTQFVDDLFRQVLIDLAMSRNWLRLFGFRIVIPVVPVAMPQHYATHFLKLFDQVSTLHATASSPT